MSAYSGKFHYTGAAGETISQGPCQLTFDKEKCSVTPSGALPISFDLGDIDTLNCGEWELQFNLFTGKSIALRQFGPAFGRMAQELSAAWRDRIVQCLLLEDLEEAGRFNGAVLLPGSAGPATAEIRIYKSNVAVLPSAGMPVQWRLADVDSIAFDPSSYTITVTRGRDRVVFSKLAKKTDEFAATLQGVFDALRLQSAEVLHNTFPFLDPDQLQQLMTVMPEGRSASLQAISAIHPKMAEAYLTRAVSRSLRPYFDALRSRAASGSIMTGYKFIRADMELDEPATEGEDVEPPAAEENTAPPVVEEKPMFFWFFFPLGNVVAWEAATGSGRATYFFRLTREQAAPGALQESIGSLTRGLALLNFRREPVYLPDDSLQMQPRFHRYAIAARKLPDLRSLRAAFAGRAIHSTLEKWSAQVDAAAK